MDFCYLDAARKEEWEKLLSRSTSSGFMQSFFWCDFKRKTGWDTYKIGLLEGEKLVGGAVAMKFHFSKNKNFLYIPEGPVMDYAHPDAADRFHKLMCEVDKVADFEGSEITTHLRIDPCVSERPAFFEHFEKAPYNMEPRDTIMVDLTQDEAVILVNMKQKARYNIKVAEREGVEVTAHEPNEKMAGEFSKIYRQTVERNKFDGKEKPYFEALFSHLQGNGYAKYFEARAGGRLLAAALVIFYGDRATYFFGASSNEERQKMAPHKLHFEIMKYAKAQGYKWYDFWGVAPENADPSHGWTGITQFKEKFGGKRFSYIGAYDFVYNHKLYDEFLKESGEV